MSRPVLIHSARLVSGGVETPGAWVLLRDGLVEARGTGAPPSVDAERVDAAGRILAPGFLDLHGHGGARAAYDDGPEAIRTALALHRAHGTTRSVLSLVTAGLDRLAERLEAIAALTRADPGVLGAHLEGPFLEDGHRGAHDPGLLREASPEAVERLLEAGAGRLVQLTLAPEQPGGMNALRRLVDAGVRVAVGHCAADYAAAAAAFDAGASILTHAFNAMPGLHHRAPGPVAAAARAGHVTLELIADGVHVHPAISRMLFAAAPGRVALITDAMAAAGAADGDYVLGGLAVRVSDGVARLADGGSIAGSTLLQDAALRHAVHEVGVPLPEAVAALTEVPARALGRAGDLGRLEAGCVADAVLLDDDLAVDAVWLAGEPVPGTRDGSLEA